jgi:hypothetical protein
MTTLNSIVNSTLFNFETIESNSTIIENVDTSINSTIEIYSNENTTLLREDFPELNQTTVSIIEEVLQDNKTNTNAISFSSTIFNELIDINQTTIKIKNESVSTEIDHLSDEFQSSLAPQTTEDNQTNGWNLLFNDKTETILFNDTFTVATNDESIINSNITQKDAIILNQETYINETEMILIETNQNSNETSVLSFKSISIPVCDRSCQCLKECRYGFEILNDTCLCNPPCKVRDYEKLFLSRHFSLFK